MDKRFSIFSIVDRQESTPGGGKFYCTIPASFIGFNGHFAKQPVVPGVCQVNWIIEAIRSLSGETPVRVQELAAMKFHNLLLPDTSFVIELEWVKDKWRYLIYNDTGQFASGRVVLRP